MSELLALAGANLLSPMVLCFVLGAVAAAIRSDLEIPEAIAKGLAIYLMLAIGMKGGLAMAKSDGANVLPSIAMALALSFALPLLAYAILRGIRALGSVDAAAVAAHYGSVSIVTFVTAVEFLNGRGVAFDGVLVAMMAAMETPAIVTGLLLARRALGPGTQPQRSRARQSHLLREVLANGSIVVLVGGFAIGWAVGPSGMEKVKPFIFDIYNGMLCLFLLDMGLVAMRQMRSVDDLGLRLVGFGLVMPPLNAAIGFAAARALGFDVGSTALLATLCASASYIAVPAAMRLALPQARPAIYVTLSLGVTFPFNVAIGIPLYLSIAQWLARSP
ncbi:MAG: sodium-dependent bicarbonate transport family permease [Alphaproteobacteria bacterium]|nr:sodium-dependent bicarbonate transport family permease [Alphaproteobacteria bacterium]